MQRGGQVDESLVAYIRRLAWSLWASGAKVTVVGEARWGFYEGSRKNEAFVQTSMYKPGYQTEEYFIDARRPPRLVATNATSNDFRFFFFFTAVPLSKIRPRTAGVFILWSKQGKLEGGTRQGVDGK